LTIWEIFLTGDLLLLIKERTMEEYKVIYPKPEINSRKQRDEHDDKLEELLLEIQKEQYRAWKQMKDKGIK
jgi:hypothetical protein